MFWDKRKSIESERTRIRNSLRKADLCLITYFVLYGLDTGEAIRELEAEGLNNEQIESIWETKVKDMDPLLFIILTGRAYPGKFHHEEHEEREGRYFKS